MKTAEPDSTIESTERLFKIIDITYAKSELQQVDNNTTQLNA